MCGIAGFYNAQATQQQIDEAINCLKHRGPDAQSSFVSGNVGLIHTRLSILELSDLGSQPYHFDNLTLVFNGEIYNFREIRSELIKHGYEFKSDGDTEVLIKAFHCWREKCVTHFIGMFAFAVYDQSTDDLFLFRDRFGVKPLYYCLSDDKVWFASERKALDVFNISKEIDITALQLYFRFGYTPHDLSIFRQIKKLEPAHYLKMTRQGASKVKYWDLTTRPEMISKSEEWWIDSLEELLISSFSYRMVSDVPVGVFLSGGIDSSLLTAILQKHCGGIHTFTIGFGESSFDESPYARIVANKLGTDHVERKLTLPVAEELFREFYSIYDEPFADTSGVPIAFVTQLAREHRMKVVLSADGGDELFGGYSHYAKASSLQRSLSKLPSAIRTGLPGVSKRLLPKRVRNLMIGRNFEHRVAALEELLAARNHLDFYEAFIANQGISEIDDLIPGHHTKSLYQFNPSQDVVRDMMMWDSQYYLPDDLLVKVDRATMYYGIESREPFLDHRIAELCNQMPMSLKIRNGDQKYILKKILSRYLPEELFRRKKQGFSIPIFAWFTETLDKWFTEYLTDDVLKQIPYLNAAAIRREFRKYKYYKQRGKEYNIEKMWRILSFLMWFSKHGK